jgi:S1-C subfamily serine protease
MTIITHTKRLCFFVTIFCLLIVFFAFTPPAVAQDGAKQASISTILRAVVGIRSKIPKEAISAQTLGTARDGSGVVIDSTGLILTVGYLVLEASEIEIIRPGGKIIPAKFIGYDSESGLSLIKATKPLKLKPVNIGNSASIKPGSRVMIVSHAGMPPVSAAQVVSRRPFAGYWEYLVDNAIYVSPPHKNYVGAVLFGEDGLVKGIGSMSVNDAIAPHVRLPGNMFVPVNAFKPVMLDLLDKGRPSGPERPWMGVHINEVDGKVKIVRIIKDGPADFAGIKSGDIIVGINGKPVKSMKALYERAWALGQADAIIPLDIVRQGRKSMRVRRISVHSQSRYQTLKIKLRKKP